MVGFNAEWVKADRVRYVISRIDRDSNYPELTKPIAGDEVIAINGRAMKDWQTENFAFCKFPLKEQCDFDLPSTFQKELLSWTGEAPLTYTILRGQRVWTISVNSKVAPKMNPDPSSYSCKSEGKRYEDFHIIYAGNRACVWESDRFAGTAVFRISGFYYSKETLEKDEPIDSLNKEIEAIYPWWTIHATWKHLIFDIIDNHGGNAPIGYYQILFQKEFQEQYVTFKKIPEMENSILRKSIFWDSPGQEIWYNNLKKMGIWARMAYGGYTPPVPMFCADDNVDCRRGLFSPRLHSFKGDVSVLINQWCVSSCDGFAYNLKEKYGDRVKFFGQPQAADTAYSRLKINVYLDSLSPDGFRLEISPLYEPAGNEALLTQTVVVTRSVSKIGVIVSGRPVSIDGFVPSTLENEMSWPNEVLKKALRL